MLWCGTSGLHFSHLDLLMINWLMCNTGQCWNFELGQVIMSDAVSSMCRICTTQRLVCSYSAASQQQWQLWVQINFEFSLREWISPSHDRGCYPSWSSALWEPAYSNFFLALLPLTTLLHDTQVRSGSLWWLNCTIFEFNLWPSSESPLVFYSCTLFW